MLRQLGSTQPVRCPCLSLTRISPDSFGKSIGVSTNLPLASWNSFSPPESPYLIPRGSVLVLNSFSAYQQYIQLIKLIHLHIKY
ncbi:unnamed protein product [Leptidea sinapis]|uniref:Uncharacterized protein n=1 Tax=Leptidea sinapis TaxID=189913 RepID=A0A5E4PL63_9NEOP|nr:unnamed protein product [Leptidea sinapis]